MWRGLAAGLIAVSSLCCQALAEEKLAAEKAFAFLMFGRSSEDPCAHISRGTQSCATRFAEKQIDFADTKAQQSYRFGPSPCVVNAVTDVTATGKRYEATFNLQHVQFVNLNKTQQEGSLMEVEFLLQGKGVIQSDGKVGNVLVIIHKYYADSTGDVGHSIKQELVDMRQGMKDYQDRFCPAMG